MGYERKNVAAMDGYVPGKQSASADVVKLNTNENPYPPCDAVVGALGTITGAELQRYPPAAAEGFRQAAARLHGLTPEQVIATNGGDELLRLAIATFVEPGSPIGVVEPSYSLYPVLAAAHGSPVVRARSGADWGPPPDLAQQMNDAGAALLFVVNPHAPSGQLTPVDTLDRLAESFDGVLLLDEAYVDFVDPGLGHDATAMVDRHDNVLVLRTLSKGYSLAGLRFGYGLGPRALIEPMLWKTRDSYNQDVIAQRLGEAALAHRAEAAGTWKRVRDERARVTAALRERGLTVGDSQTNFIFACTESGEAAKALHRGLESHGVLVRYFDTPRLDVGMRITIGTPAENDRLLNALDAVRTRG